MSQAEDLMSQVEKANRFKDLHRKGEPVILYNIWDAGGAKALAGSGARAIATGSWAMAAAHGFEDGETIPLDLVLTIVDRIARTVDLPVTMDFEGGYAVAREDVAENARKAIRAGAVGINFEDRIVRGAGLHPIPVQAARIRAIRAAADAEGVPLFLNARTDLFLGTDPGTHADRLAEAIDREAAYAEAGADGFFVPGLTDTGLISRFVEAARLPVNLMMSGSLQSVATAASLRASRVSFGPAPYRHAMSDLAARFKAL